MNPSESHNINIRVTVIKPSSYGGCLMSGSQKHYCCSPDFTEGMLRKVPAVSSSRIQRGTGIFHTFTHTKIEEIQ